MDDEKIIKNMKEVLKKTRKSKHKKSRPVNDDGDDSISEILNKNWNFRSPPSHQTEVPSPKVNIFERMMAKKPEPLTQLSPEVNGVKKKRKYTKKVKNLKIESDDKDSGDSMGEDENSDDNFKNCQSPAKGIQKFLMKVRETPEKDEKNGGNFGKMRKSEAGLEEKVEKIEKSGKTENCGKSGKSEGNGKVEKSGKTGKIEQSEKFEKPEEAEKSGKIVKSRKSGKFDQAEKSGKSGKIGKSGKFEEAEKSGKIEQSGKFEKSEEAEKSGKFGKSGKIEKSGKFKKVNKIVNYLNESFSNVVKSEENSMKIVENEENSMEIVENEENSMEIVENEETSVENEKSDLKLVGNIQETHEKSRKTQDSPLKIEENSRKRNRKQIFEPQILEKTPKNKKRRTKTDQILDLNENSVENSIDLEVSTPTYSSGRPRRSCAGNINYELLNSPDKKTSPDTPKRKKSKKIDEDFIILEDDDDSPVKPKKLAPLFIKKVPKPAIDPAVKEARRSFLMSGLPEDLRNSIDKQRQFEDEILGNELVAFPLVTHVTQLFDSNPQITENLKKSKIKISKSTENDSIFVPKIFPPGFLTIHNPETVQKVNLTPFQPVKNLKEKVKQLKEDFGDFPTNRAFKLLHKKARHSYPEDENLLFVDIFKPEAFDEFHVNVRPVKALQKFFNTWNVKTDDYDSEESGSRQSFRGLANNFAVLTGPHGTGKTCAVYSIAKDLNYQVIEINAGSRRSGKKMLQDLLEATQSHRVDSENSPESDEKSIILIEDAELVFESDDGFAASIQQLINISKRPVVLTTNNRTCQHLQKFIAHNEIVFDPGAHQIGKYLSLLCLAANYQIKPAAIEHLYGLNGRDLRKTINEIEFFIRSGAATNDGNLVEFYRRPQRQARQTSNLSSMSFELSVGVSFAAWKVDDDETSYQQRDLMNEMRDFVAARCNAVEVQRDLAEGKQKIIESSISNDLVSQMNSLSSSRALALDYSPMLRDICRSEKVRNEGGRRTTTNNRGHYLRFLSQNSFGNNYFNEQCEIFRRQ